MSPLEKSKFRYDISRNQHHIWRVSECVEWSGVEWCEEKMNLRRNKQTPAHIHARTEHLKAIFWCERTGLCHSATHRCTMLCVLWKLSHFFFLSVLSLWVRVRVRVSVRVLNIYDDDQLYQNVGKSITKIDGSKNNGPQRKINPNERTNERNDRDHWATSWNEMKRLWGDAGSKYMWARIFWARISGSKDSCRIENRSAHIM